MHQRRCLQRLAGLFMPQLGRRQFPQLVADHAQEDARPPTNRLIRFEIGTQPDIGAKFIGLTEPHDIRCDADKSPIGHASELMSPSRALSGR